MLPEKPFLPPKPQNIPSPGQAASSSDTSDDTERELTPMDKAAQMHEKRTKIVNEMLSTEQTYVKNLEGMVNLYKKRFEEYFTAEEQRGKGVPKGFKRDHLKILFSNVHVVIPLNQQLLEELTERVNNWSESQKVGDIFLKIAPYFKLYNEYSNNYEASLECFDQFYTKNIQFIKFF